MYVFNSKMKTNKDITNNSTIKQSDLNSCSPKMKLLNETFPPLSCLAALFVSIGVGHLFGSRN